MAESPFWNPKTETMPREELRRLQGHRLARAVERAYAGSAFHRRLFDEHGVTPGDIRGYDDLVKLPFTTRDAWMDSQAANLPYGEMLLRPAESAIRYHTTSGTTGRMPLRVLDGRTDWKWIAECWCYAFHGFGIRPHDIVFFAFSYGTFIGFWGAHYACEKMGCLVLPSGNMTTQGRVELIEQMGATVVCATPTYALRLAQEARDMGIDLPGGSVKRLILSGEPAGSIPASKRLIEEQWGAKAADTAGMTEIGTIMMFESENQPGGCHILEDHFIEEVIDPETGRSLDYGEQGERVVTSFGRSSLPLIRYRTRDLVIKVPHTTSSCGRTWDLYDGGIRGRVDDMLLIRGTNVYPRAVEAIVREYPAVDEFQIYLWTKDGIRDEIAVRCEVRAGFEDQWDAVARRLREDLSSNTEGLGFDVERVGAGTLPRFELKARRVLDDRVVKGS
ncbi:MAG: AMP-binding protein [Planctomycetes bacterium]|nr:AMP-binding protein [Planctomycetota bacterium]MCB9828721.1 AMP-binding protein [Planctomycetota bacterium]MCB9901085.1 AMP-binding protein [Planctomycetota bacterium]